MDLRILGKPFNVVHLTVRQRLQLEHHIVPGKIAQPVNFVGGGGQFLFHVGDISAQQQIQHGRLCGGLCHLSCHSVTSIIENGPALISEDEAAFFRNPSRYNPRL